jgi:hypothetical protein
VGTRFLPGAAACSSAVFIFVCCISPRLCLVNSRHGDRRWPKRNLRE